MAGGGVHGGWGLQGGGGTGGWDGAIVGGGGVNKQGQRPHCSPGQQRPFTCINKQLFCTKNSDEITLLYVRIRRSIVVDIFDILGGEEFLLCIS